MREIIRPARIALTLATLWSFPASAIMVGTGVSTVTEGRLVPSLNLGIDTSKDWTLSGMIGGVATDAYYCNGYMANMTRRYNFGKFGFGSLEAGLGYGLAYTRRGFLPDPKGAPDKVETDQDYSVGPAFRVAFKPFDRVYVGFEMLMGLGWGVLGNGWSDTGILAIGGEF